MKAHQRFVRGGVFLVVLSCLGSLGHLHREPSAWPLRLLVSGVELAVFALIGAALLGPELAVRRARRWLRRLLRTQSLLVFAAATVSVFPYVTFLAPYAHASGVDSVASHSWSQFNLFLLDACVCFFWLALFSRRVGRRGGLLSLVLHLVILAVVIQASLHVVRQYTFHLQLGPWAESLVAFAAIGLVGASLSWLFTLDWVLAAGHRPRRSSGRTLPRAEYRPLSVGLACSGGGIRAAVVATGVLEVLRPSRFWSRFRYVSAVSGGSWALANLLGAERGFDESTSEPERAAAVVRRQVQALKARRDYLRGGLAQKPPKKQKRRHRRSARRELTHWLVRPLIVALVGTVLQLASLALSLVFLIVLGMYLDTLRRKPGTSVLGQWMQQLPSGHGFFHHDSVDRIERLDTFFLLGERVVSLGVGLVVVGCIVLLVGRLRPLPAAWVDSFDRWATMIVTLGLLAVVAALVPMMVLASVSILVLVAFVGIVGWVYVREWKLAGLGPAAAFGAVTGAVGLLADKIPFVGDARGDIDGAARMAVGSVVCATEEVAKAIATFAANLPEPWREQEADSLSLLVCLGLVGALYIAASGLIRLELMGLGTVWRSWVAVFSHGKRGKRVAWPRSAYRPEPIVNMTVNAPEEPYRVAHFEVTPTTIGGPSVGYHPQDEQRPFSLLDAIAISSAALNSQAGRFVSGWLRPVLSILSLKLGRWLPHPRTAGRETWPLALQYMNRELLGWNSLDDAHLFLSDGGHFENLGAYALMLRRVQTVVILDAAADPDYAFFDLSRFIELSAYRGYRLELDLDGVTPTERDGSGLLRPSSNVVNGWLRYQGGEADTFWKTRPPDVRVVYAKLGLPRALSARTFAYARQNPRFPQQSTIDQFFDEAQFEAYLEVGARLGDQIVERLTAIERAGFSAP